MALESIRLLTFYYYLRIHTFGNNEYIWECGVIERKLKDSESDNFL